MKTDYTKEIVISGLDKDGQELSVQIVTDTVNKKSYLEAIGKFQLVKVLEVKEQSDVTITEDVTVTEVSPIHPSWEDFKWQLLKADHTAYYTVVKTENGVSIYTRSEGFAEVAGEILAKGLMVAAGSFLAPQDTLSFNITNAADSQGNAYALNQIEFFALSAYVREAQAKLQTKSVILSTAVTFIRS